MPLEGSGPDPALPPKPAAIPGVLLECAFTAVVQSFLVLLLGGIAVSILGGLLHDRLPSLPPGLSESLHPGPRTVATWDSAWGMMKANRLWVVSTFFFAHAVWTRFAPRSDMKTRSRAAQRLNRAFSELSNNWFGLLVGNAFAASITAMLVVWAGNLSVTRIALNVVLGGFADSFARAGGAIFGPGPVETIQGLWSWYGANQVKFTFWLLFFAAILDDLGLPNIKTLGRWFRRCTRRGQRTEPQPRRPAPPLTTPSV